jgi:hypothetical protein
MAIAKPEMYRICHNPSIRGEEKAERALAWRQIGREGFVTVIALALHQVWDDQTVICDDRRLRFSDVNTSSACQ